MANGWKIKETDMELKFGEMAINIMEIGIMIKKKEKENMNGVMGIVMKVYGKIIKYPEQVK